MKKSTITRSARGPPASSGPGLRAGRLRQPTRLRAASSGSSGGPSQRKNDSRRRAPRRSAAAREWPRRPAPRPRCGTGTAEPGPGPGPPPRFPGRSHRRFDQPIESLKACDLVARQRAPPGPASERDNEGAGAGLFAVLRRSAGKNRWQLGHGGGGRRSAISIRSLATSGETLGPTRSHWSDRPVAAHPYSRCRPPARPARSPALAGSSGSAVRAPARSSTHRRRPPLHLMREDCALHPLRANAATGPG